MSVQYDNLITNGTFAHKQVITDIIVPDGGLPRGALLGKVTATDKFKLSLKAASDGSEVAKRILGHAIANDTGSDVEVAETAWTSGSFIDLGITFGTGQTVLNTADDLQAVSIEITEGIA